MRRLRVSQTPYSSRLIALVDLPFGSKIDRGAACRDFDYQLGRALQIPIRADSGLPTDLLFQAQEGVGLEFIGQIHARGRIVPKVDAGRGRAVETAKCDHGTAGATMLPLVDGRTQVDHPLDQLGFLELGHRLVAPLELLAAQPVAFA
jgi:hypothetical protein